MNLFEADDWLLLRDLDDPQRMARAAKAQAIWQEAVPGIDSLALKYDPDITARDTALALASALPDGAGDAAPVPPPELILPVCYAPEFGPDQALVADHLAIPVADLPEWHQAQRYTVALIGFLPGFAYLAANQPVPEIPRLASPRPRVERGSVGLRGQQCAVYPLASPGGWPLIGRTPVPVFDPDAASPFLFAAGQSVRFKPVSMSEFHAR